ncbi:MAG: radical SAM protein [Methanomassiliicoccales archaeon]
MKLVYGPVSSWRLGRSLGVDPICMEPKVCSLNCVYCQLGNGGFLTTRKSEFVKAHLLRSELGQMKREADYVTFSGTGEPMLASNLGELARTVRNCTSAKVAILTNACHLCDPGAIESLEDFHMVMAKLDAANENTFCRVNRPVGHITLSRVLQGLEKLSGEYRGDFRMQLMFLEENQHEAEEMAEICRSLEPDLVYINTPLRPCMASPLSSKRIKEIEALFHGMKTECVY